MTSLDDGTENAGGTDTAAPELDESHERLAAVATSVPTANTAKGYVGLYVQRVRGGEMGSNGASAIVPPSDSSLSLRCAHLPSPERRDLLVLLRRRSRVANRFTGGRQHAEDLAQRQRRLLLYVNASRGCA